VCDVAFNTDTDTDTHTDEHSTLIDTVVQVLRIQQVSLDCPRSKCMHPPFEQHMDAGWP